MRVTAKAQRSDGWWAIEVPEVAGVFTQARRLDQIPAMVADAVALVAGVKAADVIVDVEPITDLDSIVAEAREARRIADEAGARASELMRFVLADVVQAGYTVRDAGQLLGISPQRASQLTAPFVAKADPHEDQSAAIHSKVSEAQLAAAVRRYRKFVEEVAAKVQDPNVQSAGPDVAWNRGLEHVTPPGQIRFAVKSNQQCGGMVKVIDFSTETSPTSFFAPTRHPQHSQSTVVGRLRKRQRV